LSLIQYYGTGKRKSSIARVFLRSGKGDITLFVNKRPRPYGDYFRLDAYKTIIRQPLLLTETEDKFDIFLRVSGGGARARPRPSGSASPGPSSSSTGSSSPCSRPPAC
jgi:small subunit ribosomal protein S9